MQQTLCIKIAQREVNRLHCDDTAVSILIYQGLLEFIAVQLWFPMEHFLLGRLGRLALGLTSCLDQQAPDLMASLAFFSLATCPDNRQ